MVVMGPINRLYLFMLFMFCLIVWMYFTRKSDVIYVDRYVESPTTRDSDLIVLYNRVPKTGSTSFMNIMYQLTSKNHFTAAYVNVSSKSHRWLFKDQCFFAQNITRWREKRPAIYHGHFPFISFISMGFKQPIYINVVRDPLERLVSHYYFLRYGDTYLPNKIRSKQGDKTTFDQCVEKRSAECTPAKLWVQIPYFCGTDPDCWKPGNKGALNRAKRNVINYYFLVGVTEQLGPFIEILDATLPTIFKGAADKFNSKGGFHIRKTKKKVPLEQKTIDYFKSQSIWKLEQDFYLFVKERFDSVYKDLEKRRSVEYVKMITG